VIFTNPSKVFLGNNVRIDPFTLITTGLKTGDNIQITSHCVLGGGNQHTITLGNWTFIGYGSKLFCASEDYSGDFGPVNEFWGSNKINRGDITFEDYSGVASDVIVMPNVTLPIGCTIGAKSFVYTKNQLTPWSIWFGNPIKHIKDRNKENILKTSKNNNAKCCKVIVTYFGSRRPRNNNTTTPENTLELLKHHIDTDEQIDPGVSCDTIIINNQAGFHEGNLYVDSLNNTNSKNGKYLCYTRENTGGSFAGYNFAYQKHKNDYDYFCFLEDDVIITREGVFKEAINLLESSPNIGFVSLAPIVSCVGGMHSGGGCGYASTKNLNIISKETGSLPHNNNTSYGDFEYIEQKFTSIYYQHGMTIENLRGVSPLCSNYMSHESQCNHIHNFDLTLPHIYKVGF
jgi:galactoside O-acetyltransferase